jgi:ActR/RegA family two-component response regulator
VTAGTGQPTALIVDDDVAFVLWLGEMFIENGYAAFPALEAEEALTLVKDLAVRVDVLVVNPLLRGAYRAIDALKDRLPELRVVLIRDSADGPSVNATPPALERPSPWEPISKEQWMLKIREVLMRSSAAK